MLEEWKRLARALERHWVLNAPPLKGKARKLRHALDRQHARIVRLAAKFAIDAEISETDRNEAMESARLMHSMGLLRLPYKACLFQFRLPTVEDAEFMERRGEQPHTLAFSSPRPGHSLLSLAVAEDEAIRVTGYVLKQREHGCAEMPGYVLGADFTLRRRCGHVLLNDVDYEAETLPMQMALTAVVMLGTRGISVDGRCAGTQLLTRDYSINEIRRVWIESDGTSAIDGDGCAQRHRPRMHLRRGHIRRQRYGHGLRRQKQVWIEPTIVGHVTDGIIDHRYEVAP